ncbi:MAG: T9SS type A sorting domain-containing protein [Ignavibacteria bacterium]|nr:T9SS type A sorting domain-containing protein [Ignavibacteria bacterium]
MRTFLLILLSLFPYWTSSQPVWIDQSATPQGNIYSIKFFRANSSNLFNTAINFGFRVADFGLVKLTIYDALGKEIAIIVNEQLQPGSYNIDLDASNYPSGIYFYKIESGEFVESKKMVLIK